MYIATVVLANYYKIFHCNRLCCLPRCFGFFSLTAAITIPSLSRIVEYRRMRWNEIKVDWDGLKWITVEVSIFWNALMFTHSNFCWEQGLRLGRSFCHIQTRSLHLFEMHKNGNKKMGCVHEIWTYFHVRMDLASTSDSKIHVLTHVPTLDSLSQHPPMPRCTHAAPRTEEVVTNIETVMEIDELWGSDFWCRAHQRPQEMCRVLAVHRGCMDDIWLYDGMMCTNIYIYTHTHTCIQYSLFKEVSMRFNEELNHVFNEDFHHSRGVNQQCLDHIWWQNDCYICTWSIYGIIDGIYLMICWCQWM